MVPCGPGHVLRRPARNFMRIPMCSLVIVGSTLQVVLRSTCNCRLSSNVGVSAGQDKEQKVKSPETRLATVSVHWPSKITYPTTSKKIATTAFPRPYEYPLATLTLSIPKKRCTTARAKSKAMANPGWMVRSVWEKIETRADQMAVTASCSMLISQTCFNLAFQGGSCIR